MLYPPVADMLKNVESRYLLVNVVASRARVISDEAEALQEELEDKPVTLAIREVAEGKLTASLKDEYKNHNSFKQLNSSCVTNKLQCFVYTKRNYRNIQYI